MKNVSFRRNGVEFEPTKQELKIVLDDYAKQLGERDKRIADLEKELQEWQDGAIIAQWQDCEQRVKELEYELAEKEKELRYKTAECDKWKRDYENCSKLEKIISKERQYCLDNWRVSEEAKTDFAIEQLEKVRNEIDKADNAKSYFEGMEKWSKDKRDYFDLGFSDCQSCVWDIVDWQIHELKGEENV